MTTKASKYKWVFADEAAREAHDYAKRLFSVGILADGTLHNPNGYPEDVVRAAVLAADAHWHEHRSRAAKKAAVTRAERKELKVDQIARRIAKKQQTGPASHCYVCGRGLSDPPSIERGIGSECWQDVLDKIERIIARAA